MKIIGSGKSILVNNEIEIKAIQYFDEDEDTLRFQTVEHIPEFKRGYICNMRLKFGIYHGTTSKESLEDFYYTHIKDLLLVHIRRTTSVDSMTSFEYIFYK